MQPTLNANSPSWTNIKITVNVLGGQTAPAIDIKSITWESKVERGMQRGASGGRVLKRTTGQKTDTAAAEFYRDGLRTLVRWLIEVAPKDSAGRPMLSQATFDVVIKFALEGDPEIYETKLTGCHLDKIAGSHAEGTDPDVIAVDLNPIEVIEVIDGQDTVLL